MNRTAVSFISVHIYNDGTFALNVSNQEGYNEVTKRDLTYETAYAIAEAIDTRCGTAYHCRNQVSAAEAARKKRVQELEQSLENIQAQIDRLKR